MKKGVLHFVVSLMVYVRSAPINSEIVWLKDVTAGLQLNKRISSDLDLPDALTFTFSRGSHALNLNLKRNHEINPNADVYVVQELKDGRFHVTKSQNLEQEDVAYYQDVENGAFMTVRCVRRSSGQCDRFINGNIRIEGTNYDLRPAETDLSLRNYLGSHNLRGTKYVMLEQGQVQRKFSVGKGDEANVNGRTVEKEFPEQVQRLRRVQDKQNRFLRRDATLSSRNVACLHDRDTKDEVRNLKESYQVEMGILVDSGIWDLHSSLVQISDEIQKEVQVKKNIREYFSHIINGVNLLYKGIKDESISITVTLLEFFFFKKEREFPHNESEVVRDAGETHVDANLYLNDIRRWDVEYSEFLAPYDHAMLFTKHGLFNIRFDNKIAGLSFNGDVCDIGGRTSVVQIGDYFQTVSTAAHELGHNLGAFHDGPMQCVNCSADYRYIMAPKLPEFQKDKSYSRNPWLFSHCSVEAFKRTLRHKKCLSNIGGIYDGEEWTKNVMRLPGEVYTPSRQCQLIMGHKSNFCGVVSEDICLFMKCRDPKTGTCLRQRFAAARGTKCGHNKWCKEGECVSKGGDFEIETNEIDL